MHEVKGYWTDVLHGQRSKVAADKFPFKFIAIYKRPKNAVVVGKWSWF